MAKFSKDNFYRIVNEIESMEASNQNIWVSIGILEVMHDDNEGWIDFYFHCPKADRNIEQLWQKVNK